MRLNHPSSSENESNAWLERIHKQVLALTTSAAFFVGGVMAEKASAQAPSKGGRAVPVSKTTDPSNKESAEAGGALIEQVGEGQWVVHRSEAEKNDEGMRGPSMIPTPLVLEPITLTATADIEPNGEAFDKHFILNLPRDIGDTARLKSNVVIKITGLKDFSTDLTMVTSKSHNNQFLSVHITGIPTGGPIHVEIKELSWMSHPKNVVPEGKVLSSAYGSLVNSAEAEMAKVNQALTYDANVRTLDLSQVHGKGDCGVFAATTRKNTEGKFELVGGYCEDCIEQNGGGHAWNISTKGNVRFDGAMKRYGPENGAYIATFVGTDLDVDPSSPYAIFNGPDRGINGLNAVGTGGNITAGKVELSTVRKGIDAPILARYKGRDQKEFNELRAAHLAHVKQRTEVRTAGKTASSK